MFGVFVLHNAHFCLCLEKIIKCSPCPFFFGGGGGLICELIYVQQENTTI